MIGSDERRPHSEPLTPKQVARAIQVSESSVKRWCDKGIIPTQYTAGGHRRIPMTGLLAFLKSSKHQLLSPEVLGLPATTGQTYRVIDRAATEFVASLQAGDETRCWQIVLDLFLAEHSVSKICDLVLARALQAMGDLWECGEAEVYQERLGCGICGHLLHDLRAMTPLPPPDAPLALGGTPEGDQYNVATTMAELVLRDNGWNAVSLGNNLPFGTLRAAIAARQPRIFWLSISHVADKESFLRGYAELFDSTGADVAFVVGGRALTDDLRQQMSYAAFCDTMQHLASFANSLGLASRAPTISKVPGVSEGGDGDYDP